MTHSGQYTKLCIRKGIRPFRSHSINSNHTTRMDIKAVTEIPQKLTFHCIVTGIYDDQSLAPTTKQLDKLSGGAISKLVKSGDISGKAKETLMLRGLESIESPRILLVGLGKKKDTSESSYRAVTDAAMKALLDTPASTALNALPEIGVDKRDLSWKCQVASQAAIACGYRFDRDALKNGAAASPYLKTALGKKSSATKVPANKSADKSGALKKLTLRLPDKTEKAAVRKAAEAIKAGKSIALGSALARDLGNMPPNICTPAYLATLARKLSRRSESMKCRIVEEAEMKKLGMQAFLSVSRGSRQPAKLIIMEYLGASNAKAKPLVLVGKGITFDTGGISIKPSAAMDEMKFDMCGAASVFGVAESLIELKPKKNVILVIAAAENMPDGDASRPGDVVNTMSNQSVEILNTDAEGRLVLCDTLTYVERFNPSAVIDVATLTGACIVALGHIGSAMMANDEELAKNLLEASVMSGDKTWQLPLWDEYQQQLDSNFADIGNIGGAAAGSITAGCFLSRFAKSYAWAHLDIAGIAWKSGAAKGATGRPVPLLMQYLMDN